MKVWREENFAPVAGITAYRDDDEVIGMANDTEYGLAAYVYTHDIRRIWKLMRALEYGMVSVNSVKMTGPADSLRWRQAIRPWAVKAASAASMSIWRPSITAWARWAPSVSCGS